MLSELLLAELGRSNTRDKLPLHRRLYEVLRRAILDGKLAPGARLPSSRQLVCDLGLSRNTVVSALSQLGVEGYLVSQVGSGTFVSDKVVRSVAAPHPTGQTQNTRLSQRGQFLATRYGAEQLEVQPFTPGPADFSAFPVAQWQRLQSKHWRMNYPDMLDYSYSGGYAPLRRAVADYLRIFRGVPADADQVLITSGTQQSMQLCAHVLADQGDTVWLEDPAYWGAVKAFHATGLQLHPVRVDEQGIAPADADDAHPPRLIYVTPSHQYPTGPVMSLARRQQVLQRAREHQAWIVEDDYDSEFRFDGPPLASLSGLDQDARVLYMGSFSKVLYPGLKLGYLVVPRALAQPFVQAHYDLNRPGQMHIQAALAEFIEMGHFASALRRARASYAIRRRELLQALQPCLGPEAWIGGAEQGLHLCLHFPVSVDDAVVTRRIGALGMTARPLSAYCLRRTDLRGLVIGYGYAPLAGIREFGPQLADAISGELSRALHLQRRQPPDSAKRHQGAGAGREEAAGASGNAGTPTVAAFTPSRAAAGTTSRAPGSAS